MWLFRGRDDGDEDSDEFESDDYDSDEYETDDEDEPLDSNSDNDEPPTQNNKDNADDMPERAETEEDFSEEEEVVNGNNKDDNAVVVESEEEESSVEKDNDESDLVTEELHDESSSIESVEVTPKNSHESDDESDEEEDASDEDSDEEATSLAEKQALLALAAENDRVDILKAILTDSDRDALLHHYSSTSTDQHLPPLHIAITYGSTHATSCLLRMGANPAIRPDNKKQHASYSAWELAESVKMAPSKREGIRHAFTAEALRCIGSDEVERLQHLLDSGMPPSIDIGGKNLYGWSVEMGATKCQALTKPFEPKQQQQEKTLSAVVYSHPDSDSLLSLDNRLEELDSLAKALSCCLDNLAEEVSVCHGLLLLGGGASALASHVRSLKLLKERRETELERWMLDWEDSQDELAYWLQQSGGSDGFTDVAATTSEHERKRSFTTPENDEDEEAQRRQLKAQIAASENKVRKLRSSIADLSEENARDLVEVEKRGLSGGIKLVRTLREELREVEFQLSEAKSGTASCRARVNLIVSRLEGEKKKVKHDGVAVTEPRSAPNGEASVRVSSLFADENPSSSDRIASGESEAIALRQPGNRGYLPIDLWDIILRIIGLGRVAVKKSVRDNTPSAMII